MERRTFLTVCLAAIAMSALFYTHLNSENHSDYWRAIPQSIQSNQVVNKLLDSLNFRSWAERLGSDDVEYDEVDVSLLSSQSVERVITDNLTRNTLKLLFQVDEEDYDSPVDDDTTNDEKEYYTDYEEETDEELEKELPDATDWVFI